MQIRRWFRLFLKGKTENAFCELASNNSISQDQVKDTADLLQKLGLT